MYRPLLSSDVPRIRAGAGLLDDSGQAQHARRPSGPDAAAECQTAQDTTDEAPRITDKTATHSPPPTPSARRARRRSSEAARPKGRVVGATAGLHGRLTPPAGRMMFGKGGHPGDGFGGAAMPDEQLGHF